MVQAPPQRQPLLLQLPEEIALQVTRDQFALLVSENRDLRLERTSSGSLIVNPPIGGESGRELRSETDSLQKLREKMQEYMDNGAQLGWLIDPKNKRVEIYRVEQVVEVLEMPTTLSGEDILPGFTLTLKRIWD